MKGYALITGASSGIGKSIAFDLAKRGFDLLLTARSEHRLKEIAGDVSSRCNVKAEYLPVDLSSDNATARIDEWCGELGINPVILINNAGYGLWGDFEQLNIDEQANMLRLNAEALVRLSYLMLPRLKTHPKSYILNVASTAAYQAVPTLAVYAATKAFVISFSRALRKELLAEGVSVSVLSPGPTDTGFVERAGMDAIKEIAEKFNMDADVVAAAGVKGLLKGKAEIIPGFLNKLSAFGGRHLPKSVVEGVAVSMYRKNK